MVADLFDSLAKPHATIGGNQIASDNTGIVKGNRIVYRALFCGYFNARIAAVHPDGCVDLEVFSDAGKNVLNVTGIKVAESVHRCQPGQAYMGERPEQ